MDKKPEIVVFAGPNGSGKSTLTELLKPKMDYINADEIKKYLKCSDIEAAQEAELQRENHLLNKVDFCFETVLSTDRNLNLLKRAKDAGYFIRCYYVFTTNPEINMIRVRFRIESGGHSVPEDKIVSRYYKTFDLAKEVVAISDICHIYDNSQETPRRFFKKAKRGYYFEVCTGWEKEQILSLTGVTDMQEDELNRIKKNIP
jgi:predicted ABC-type ATPase